MLLLMNCSEGHSQYESIKVTRRRTAYTTGQFLLVFLVEIRIWSDLSVPYVVLVIGPCLFLQGAQVQPEAEALAENRAHS